MEIALGVTKARSYRNPEIVTPFRGFATLCPSGITLPFPLHGVALHGVAWRGVAWQGTKLCETEAGIQVLAFRQARCRIRPTF
jgi:hypothetical protein